MTEYLQYAVLGLGAGALYAALAQGIVLAHRGAGVINLAHGAMAMFVAYMYAGLRSGRLMLPPLPNPLSLIEGVLGWFGNDTDLPNWPTFIDVGKIATVPAFALSLVIAAVLGWLLHLLTFKSLRTAPPLAKTVAAVGVMLLLQAIVSLRFGTENLAVPAILPKTTVKPFGVLVPVNRLILLAFAVAMTSALVVLSRRTKFGIATQAAAENERGATMIGLSVDRLAALNWTLSSVVAGAAGILFSSLTGVNPVDFVLYVIPALGAALLARLTSFSIAAAAGLSIGVAQSLTYPLQSDIPFFPKTGAAAGVPFIVLIVAMVVRGDRLPTRGAVYQARLPSFPDVPGQRRLAFTLGPAAVLGMIFLPYDFRGGLINSLSAVVIALSFVVLVGMAGQLSLMQMAIAGMSALAMTRLAGDWGIPFPLSPLIAILVGTVLGVIAGLPALRVRGVQLAVLTLGAAYAFERMVLSNGDYLRTTDSSGSVPPASLFGLTFDINDSFPFGSAGAPNAWFGIFVLAVVVGCGAFVIRIRRSSLGLSFLAMRSNERAAAAVGVNVNRAKLIAFVLAAMLAGVAGVLSAYRFQGLTAPQYGALVSVSALAVAYLGGISSLTGAILAGTIAVGGIGEVIVDRLFHAGELQPLISALGLIVMAQLNPEGIAGVVRETRAVLTQRVRRRRPTADVGTMTHGRNAATHG